jgi:hypothetical protein
VSAVSFIENLDAALLNMDPADFELCAPLSSSSFFFFFFD